MSNSGVDVAMPPKKSRAARKSLKASDENQGKVVELENGHDESGDESEEEKDIFRNTIVEGKRKRSSLPAAEQFLRTWLNKNFVVQDEGALSTQDMYSVYVEACTSALASGVDLPKFIKVKNELFPGGIALMVDSPYKDVVHVAKKKKEAGTKDASEKHKKSPVWNIKELIHDAITDLGNPRKGVRSLMIAHNLWGRYPALRTVWNAKKVTSYVERELRYGHIECVRGIGACGFYRLPRTPEEEEHEVAEEKRIKKEREALKMEKDRKKDDEVGTDAGSGAEESGKEGKDVDGDKDKDNDTAAVDMETDKDKKKKKKKKKKATKMKREKIVYGEPKRIEDVFPLAITYNSEPKEASLMKIRRYVQQYYYSSELSLDKLKRCLESGCERGYWLQVTGQTYQLTIESFDPTADDDLIGQVMNAIVACTEPKVSSSLLLKKYIAEYHPEFKVTERPFMFKKALERAINKNIVVQLSGIGAIGSFQLSSPFTPSPSVLQGNDTASDYEDDTSVSDFGSGGGTQLAARDSFNADMFRDAYVPRPTKRHGRRAVSAPIQRLDPSLPTPRVQSSARKHVQNKARHGKDAKKSSTKVGGLTGKPDRGRPPGKKSKLDDSSESESESEDEKPEYTPRKSASRGGKSAATRKRSAARDSDSESDQESESGEYSPRKSKSRGGRTPVGKGLTGNKVAKKSLAAAKRGRPAKKGSAEAKRGRPATMSIRKKVSSANEESSDEEQKVEYTPAKSLSRGAKQKGLVSGRGFANKSSGKAASSPESERVGSAKTDLGGKRKTAVKRGKKKRH